MTGFLTTYGANQILSGTAMPTTWWIKGHLGNPGVDGTSLPAFEDTRFSITMTGPVDGASENESRSKLEGTITTEDWTHLTLWDDQVAGNAWWVVPLSSLISVQVSNTISLQAGLLVLSFVRWT